MNTGISERRIRNNRIRRRRQLHRNLMMCLFTFLLIIGFSGIFFGLKTRAQSSEEAISYKYYKSISVESGDTLWDYAEQYGDEAHYKNNREYIKEVMQINALTDTEITSGQYIILPYYSTQFVG